MHIYVTEELRDLANIFEKNGEQLYMVGGYVRDSIMREIGDVTNDIDLCSSCRPEKVCQILSGTKFAIDQSHAHLGTTIIYGCKRYEHTTFRRENYSLNGEHNPSGIEFIKDINLDARRRDFTVNAIYYNICNDQIVDPVGGLTDLKNHILKTPINSFDSFKSDAERILRMVRFACTLNFEVDEKVLKNAVQLADLVEVISKTRLRNEFDKMLICDTIYPNKKECRFAHARCLLLLGKLGILKHILPCLYDIQQCNLKDEKGEQLFEHIVKTFAVSLPQVRLACLMHDVGKVYAKLSSNSFEFNKDWANIIIEQNLGIDGLGYPKSKVEEIKKIVGALDWDKHGYKTKKQVRLFIRDNTDIFENLCFLKDAISLENTDYTTISKIALRWKGIYSHMVMLKTPLNLSQLMIDGNDIKNTIPSIKDEKIGEILTKMLDYCLHNPRQNEANILINKVKKLVLKRPKYYLK